ncbi:secondary thiamine-phosphate synthase enzyme YjbQ [Sulfurimonas sp. C5]|uniref:secondary thiamine-phosphate synthase enzyme YjbQ n=1 Tax=Sulfurimonas sp. C5 TaxID=3036947 RepID=UPI002457ED0C|nr:secondary thiamine-phosphate synthase enzyme YjbQ [Sulfurimonas sp. C5]MDH4945437.1 secondary thiamine-phosphate synthase enzyme YjbQ [Sulfurimonas sp. C5]
MSIFQKTIKISPKTRGFHLITKEIENALVSFSNVSDGILHIFLKHTSASLTINENADPTVRDDMEEFFCDTVDDKPYYVHTYEGKDDMPAHIKSSLLGNSLNIPVSNGKMNLGTWQGIYLGEHRDHGGSRTLVLTLHY